MRNVLDIILKNFINCPADQKYYAELWNEFSAAEFADANFIKDIIDGSEVQFWQRVWEMLLARHLARLNYRITSATGEPDFRFEVAGKTVWCEATAPEPKGIPDHWVGCARSNRENFGLVMFHMKPCFSVGLGLLRKNGTS